ncbi:hypothetical protein ACPUEK_05865 [Marinomonas gallaica]|uniref:hypothetical protein n=1 Tax=Marinomonas gallaica TaxID=1806667 RepID=UPI003CE52E09
MSEFILEGQRFNTDDLSEVDLSTTVAYRYTEKEVGRLKRRIGMFSTARNAYVVRLSALLPEPVDEAQLSEAKVIRVNNRAYPIASLSQDALNHFSSVKECDKHIQRLDVDLAIAETALMGYGQAVKSAVLG